MLAMLAEQMCFCYTSILVANTNVIKLVFLFLIYINVFSEEYISRDCEGILYLYVRSQYDSKNNSVLNLILSDPGFMNYQHIHVVGGAQHPLLVPLEEGSKIIKNVIACLAHI